MENPLQFLSKEAKKKVENIIRLISHDNFGADKFRREVSKIADCKRVLDDSGDEEVAKEGFTK